MAKDILLNADLDLLIQNGDLVAGHSTEQHIGLIMVAEKGEWKPTPWLGASIRSLINAEDEGRAFKRELQKQLSLDGAEVERINISSSGVEVEATYEDNSN
jgi:hypothetical protein